MNNEKSRLIFPLACCAMISVATFSGIGIAAITGQLAVSPESGELFAASSTWNRSAGEKAETPVVEPTHVGLTRSAVNSASEDDEPMIVRVSQRFSETLEPACGRCGVVTSIERHDLQMPGGSSSKSQFVATGVQAGSAAKAALAGSNRSVYASSKDVSEVATSFIVRLRMEDGSIRTIYEHQRPAFSVGEKVQLINGSVISLS